MSQLNQPHNPLLHPPFYLIPGISPNSPISQQIEQIDQLNTLLLQEIDANFARFHQIVTTRVLPEIKRFAIAGEPTRDAAKFWRSFFEAAAAVRATPSSDLSTLSPSNHSHQASYTSHDQSLPEDSYVDNTIDGSFMFQNGLVTSTPMANGKNIQRQGPSSSWEASIESPFDSIDRRLRDDLRLSEDRSDEMTTPSLPSGYSLPTLEKPDQPSPEQSSTEDTPTPKAERIRTNPFGQKWDGIADLRSTPLTAGKIKKHSSKTEMEKKEKDKIGQFDWEEETDDDLKFNMSPPVTMTFGGLPPRVQAAVKISQTPRKPSAQNNQDKENAMMMLNDLMEEINEVYKPSPRMSTPEGLRRYSVVPPNSQGRQLFPSTTTTSNQPTDKSRLSEGRMKYRKSLAGDTTAGSVMMADGIYTDEDSDLEDEGGSFDTISGPSIVSHDQQGSGVMVTYDDSFSLLESPPQSGAYQYHTGTASGTEGEDVNMVFGGPRAGAQEKFELKKREEMNTYHGGKLEDAAGMDVATSPTAALARK
ncbi:hypothetical protein M231_05594 [Tremella mesenterica]|uniref:DASH complex subunit ASK1 n=1 Tax=Tremella mesenterica TaxID=5217 RepID=A0A4Q1BHQ8_TREME|nr:hypothetical protein M231_05594 [Tremella mesenterica]